MPINGFDDLIPAAKGQPASSGTVIPGQQGGIQGFNDLLPAKPQQQPSTAVSGDDAYSQRLASIDQQSQAIAGQSMQDMSAWQAASTTFHKQVGDLVNGIKQLVLPDASLNARTPIYGTGTPLPTADEAKAKLAAQGGVGKVLANPIVGYTPSVNEQQTLNEQQATQARDQHPLAAAAGDVAGFGANAALTAAGLMAGGAVLGTAAAGVAPETMGALSAAAKASPVVSMLGKMGVSAAANAGFAGAQYTQPGQSRLDNMLQAGAIGAALPPTLTGLGSVAEQVAKPVTELYDHMTAPAKGFLGKMFSPEGAALKDTAGAVLNTANSQAAEEAARNGVAFTPLTGTQAADAFTAKAAPSNAINVPLTPSEVMGGDAMPTMESRLGVSSTGKNATEVHLGQVRGALGKQVTDVINSIVPEGDSATVHSALNTSYDQLKNYSVPQDQYSQLMQNPTIAKYAMETNKSDTLPQSLTSLPDNNVFKLDNVNRQINHDLSKGVSSVTKDAGKNIAGNDLQGLTEAKNQIIQTLNSNTPDNLYANTLSLAQRNIQRDGMMKNISDIVNGPRSDIPNNEQIYKKLWGTDTQRQNFLSMVQNAGGDTKTASNIISTVNDTVNTPLTKILSGTRVAAETTANAMERKSLTQQAFEALTSNQYKTEMLKLALSGSQGQAKIANYLQQMDAPGIGLSDKMISLYGALKSLKDTPAPAMAVNKAIIGNQQPVTAPQTGYLSQ